MGERAIRRIVRISACGLASLSVLLGGCAQEMMNQPRVESQEASQAFLDGRGSRSVPEHTVTAALSARGKRPRDEAEPSLQASLSEVYRTGQHDGEFADSIPEVVTQRFTTKELIQRGQDRFAIYCVPCHDQTGSGNGMVARRGFKFPPSYHTDRLRQKPLGYLFHIATKGRNVMPSYERDLSTDDRWAIAAYVRTLQWSQYVPSSELSEADRKALQAETRRESQE